MSSQPQRERIAKGPIRPPPRQVRQSSYTQPPASKEDMVMGTEKQKNSTVEFASRAVPQPFLDPGILQRRLQAEQQWKLEQERTKQQDEASASSLTQ